MSGGMANGKYNLSQSVPFGQAESSHGVSAGYGNKLMTPMYEKQQQLLQQRKGNMFAGQNVFNTLNDPQTSQNTSVYSRNQMSVTIPGQVGPQDSKNQALNTSIDVTTDHTGNHNQSYVHRGSPAQVQHSQGMPGGNHNSSDLAGGSNIFNFAP